MRRNKERDVKCMPDKSCNFPFLYWTIQGMIIVVFKMSENNVHFQNPHRHWYHQLEWGCGDVPGPVCFNLKFSSLNVFPYIDFPPVPLWLVKSPPCNRIHINNGPHDEHDEHIIILCTIFTVGLTWHMNSGMTLWNTDPLYPKPCFPVHRALKFAVN